MRLMEIDRTGTCFAMTRPVLPLPDGCSSLGREKNIRARCSRSRGRCIPWNGAGNIGFSVKRARKRWGENRGIATNKRVARCLIWVNEEHLASESSEWVVDFDTNELFSAMRARLKNRSPFKESFLSVL